MKITWLLYAIILFAVFTITFLFISFIIYQTVAFLTGQSFPYAQNIIAALLSGIFAANLSPLLKKLTGVTYLEKRDNDKFAKRYPITSEELPIKELSFGDYIEFNNGTVYKYNGRFMKKHLLLSSPGTANEECNEIPTDILIRQVKKIWSEHGIKWEKPDVSA